MTSMETQSPLTGLLRLEFALTAAALHPSASRLVLHPSLFLLSCTLAPCFLSSPALQVFLLLSLSVSRSLCASKPLSVSPRTLLSLSAQHLCRLEFVGPRRKAFFYFFILSCAYVCVLNGEGRGGNTQEHLTNISSRYVEV